MRTTVRLDDSLLRDARALAGRSGRTLTSLIEDGLREVLSRSRPVEPRPRAALPTFDGGGLQPGVDLDDSASLTELMEPGAPA